jgi:hypothetical protein
MKLTPTQEKLLNRFPFYEWKTAYDLKTPMSTLNALVRKGVLAKRWAGTLGAFYSPQTTIQYRRLDKPGREA